MHKIGMQKVALSSQDSADQIEMQKIAFSLQDDADQIARRYTSRAIRDVCIALGIEENNPAWREQLAPFASVIAAQITAASNTNAVLIGELYPTDRNKLVALRIRDAQRREHGI